MDGDPRYSTLEGLNKMRRKILWQELSAPWSARGAVAVWVFDNKLFMTGGKYSFTEKGEITFVYSNDVWALSKKTE